MSAPKLPTGPALEAIKARLRVVWSDKSMTMADISRHLGITIGALYRLSVECELPRRGRTLPIYRDDFFEPTPEEDAASRDSLRLSPYVQDRIDELRIGMGGVRR